MIVEIAAADDPRIADYGRVADPAWLRSSGLFVAEGRLVVTRLIASSGFQVHSVLLTPTALERLPELVEIPQPVYVAPAAILDATTGIQFHRGCIALGHRPQNKHRGNTGHRENTEETQGGQTVLLALEGVANPDNVGGLFRVAEAFGVAGVLIDPATADPLYRKAVRTSMGSVFSVPFARLEPWPGALVDYKDRGFHILALTPRPEARLLSEVARDAPERFIVLVGAEGQGLSAAAFALANVLVRVPIAAAVDSLNVTVAAGIALSRLTG